MSTHAYTHTTPHIRTCAHSHTRADASLCTRAHALAAAAARAGALAPNSICCRLLQLPHSPFYVFAVHKEQPDASWHRPPRAPGLGSTALSPAPFIASDTTALSNVSADAKEHRAPQRARSARACVRLQQAPPPPPLPHCTICAQQRPCSTSASSQLSHKLYAQKFTAARLFMLKTQARGAHRALGSITTTVHTRTRSAYAPTEGRL
mmetsp:Transcript_53000/g.115650  ORF Transcript_53000/g.115650 Transcript_53000/m.115650 type:complete len:207 (-) Transcript_53000:301-921(-)|eukprot:5441838-Pleurochrysis_carterae.AAC.2